MKDGRISGYFDTKFMTVLWREQIFHNFEDHKFAFFFNLEQVNFRVTLVKLELFKKFQTAPYMGNGNINEAICD